MSSVTETEKPSKTPRWRRFAPLAVILAALAAVYLSGLYKFISFEALSANYVALKAWVAEHPVLSGVCFVVFYALAVTISVPGALWFTIAGGLLFGWWLGGIYSWAGATAGATFIFLAARTALRDTLRAKAGSRLDQFKIGFEKDAFAYLLMLRIIPLPFFVINVAPAFFNVRVRTFVAATTLGIIPGTFAYSTLGAGAGEAVAAGRNLDLSILSDPKVLGGIGMLLLLSLAAFGLKRFRARLEKDA